MPKINKKEESVLIEAYKLAAQRIQVSEDKKVLETKEKMLTEKIFTLVGGLLDTESESTSEIKLGYADGVPILVQSQYVSTTLSISENAVETLKGIVPKNRLKSLVYTKEILHDGALDILFQEKLITETVLNELISKKANTRRKIIKIAK